METWRTVLWCSPTLPNYDTQAITFAKEALESVRKVLALRAPPLRTTSQESSSGYSGLHSLLDDLQQILQYLYQQ